MSPDFLLTSNKKLRTVSVHGTVHSSNSVKVVMLGDSGVGKTAILTQFFEENFEDTTQPTIGIDFRHKMYKLDDWTTVRLQLWDTAGQERFRQLAPAYIREAQVALIVFDLTQENSVEQIVRWVTYVERERGDQTRVLLIGNKCDLKNERKISSSTITSMMKDHGAMYIETSAKTGENIKELFNSVAHLPFPQRMKSKSEPVNLSVYNKKDSPKCCV